jgi:nucleoside-diphosphate-sugar epimerase
MEKEKKILITGGSGFIGNHLAQKFFQEDYNVTIFDLNFPDNKEIDFFKGDLFNLISLKDAVSDKDVIIHLVGLADVGIAQKNPMKSFQLNVVSLQNVLEACKNEDKKIVFPSSAAVYGVTDDLPIKENFALRPTNIYSWHKMICEKLIKSYKENYRLNYVILRLFNVYGRGNKGVMDVFLDMAKEDKLIETFGPYQYRDFVYAGDVAEAIYRSVVYDKAVNRIINIGSGKGTQIRELFDIIRELLPNIAWKEIKSEFDMYDSISDITLAKILLDFKPNYSREFIKEIMKKEMI